MDAFDGTPAELLQLQPDGFGQLCLPVVESPESLGLEFERGGNVESVEGAGAKLRSVPSGEFNARFHGIQRQIDLIPQPNDSVSLESPIHLPCLDFSEQPSEYMLRDGIGPFCPMQRSKP